MAEEKVLDDLKYSKGTQICAKFSGIKFPDDNGETLLKINRRSLLYNRFHILDTLTPIPQEDGRIVIVSTLQESHDFVIYDPKRSKLLKVTYSCSPEKTGEVAFNVFKRKIKPYSVSGEVQIPFYSQINPVVNKELVKKSKFSTSIELALKKLKLSEGKSHYASSVFFDIPYKKLDDFNLEDVTTDAAREVSLEPIGEYAQRYPGQGYTMVSTGRTSLDEMVLIAVHNYPGLNTVHVSTYGPANYIRSVNKRIEKGMKSRTGLVTATRDAWF